ncbi:MAG: hypothetical protein E6R03_04215 [Hyphomicrobiaceae bacterium]|nr:MAG: hypothetical protein E6R03_04215 [Hyphomicrobiaceae bacterium]
MTEYVLTNLTAQTMLLQMTNPSGSGVMVGLKPNEPETVQLHPDFVDRPTMRHLVRTEQLRLEKSVPVTAVADVATSPDTQAPPSRSNRSGQNRPKKTDSASEGE